MLAVRQNGIDMRIGLDIASIALKRKTTKTIFLAGDKDFAAAAGLAVQEGARFMLDQLWMGVRPDFSEHAGVHESGLPNTRPRGTRAAADGSSHLAMP